MTTAKSVYPIPVEDLLPKARKLADRLGELPSRNRLKSELRIGSKKANALLEHLTETGIDGDTTESGTTRLHLVSDTESGDADADTEPVATAPASPGGHHQCSGTGPGFGSGGRAGHRARA